MGDGGDFGSGPRRRQERRGFTAIDGTWYCAGTGSRWYRYLRPEGEHGPFWGGTSLFVHLLEVDTNDGQGHGQWR